MKSFTGNPLICLRSGPKNEIVSYLESKKIATRMLFAGNIIRQPAFHGQNHRIVSNLENTDVIMNNTFWIGVYPGIDSPRINYILEEFDSYLNKFL